MLLDLLKHVSQIGSQVASAGQDLKGEREGPQQRDRGTLFCYGVGNDVPGRAQNGVGCIGPLSPNRET
jgi:hypothetical protein